jgi:protein SCO1/2
MRMQFVLILAVMFVITPSGYADETDPHAHHKQMMSNSGRYDRSLHTYDLDGVKVIRSDGAEMTLEEALGNDKPVMIHFIFTTCTTICPVQAATFAQVQRKLGDEVADVRMVSISIDPEYDTPSRLRDYAGKFRAGPQWAFVTGTTDQIIRAQRVFDAYEGGKMNHKPLTLLRDAGSDEWVRMDGLVNASDIITEYRKLAGDS